MIEKILYIIKLYLEGKYPQNEDYPFYLELEKELLFDNYDQMYEENMKVAEILNEEIPDICAMAGEIGEAEFKKLLKREYDMAIKEFYG